MIIPSCKQCYLGQHSQPNTKLVNGIGNSKAQIMFVGEAPGQTEAFTGIPFTGDSGETFNELLALAGIKREDCYITNVCKCWPWKLEDNKKTGGKSLGNKEPKEFKAEITICKKYLVQEIDEVNPKVIVALGGTALSVLEDKVSKITERKGIPGLYGKKNSSSLYGNRTYIMPTLHPSYVRRNGGVSTALGITKVAEEVISHFKRAQEMVTDQTLHLAHQYTLVDSIEKMEECKKVIFEKKVCAFDIESVGLGIDDDILGIGFATDIGKAYYIPFLVKAFMSTKLERFFKPDDEKVILGHLANILESEEVYKTGHNSKLDIRVIRKKLNIEVKNLYWDSMCGAYLLNENGKHGLEDLKNEFLDLLGYTDKCNRESNNQHNMSNCSLKTISDYCMGDCDATYRLTKSQTKEFEKYPDFQWLMDNFYTPLMDVFSDMEFNGVMYDATTANERKISFQQQADELLKKMHMLVGFQFNPNSPHDLIRVLFNVLKLPKVKETKEHNICTDKDVMTELAKVHVVPKMIVDYRHLNKMNSTYIDRMLEEMDSDHRVHLPYNPIGTVTGRPSSRGLMNIPKTGDIKSLFMAPNGSKLVQGDLSQAEVRCFAHYAKEEFLIKTFATEGIDVHCLIASEVKNISYEELFRKSKIEEIQEFVDLRQAAKSLVFGILYGRGAESVAEENNLSLEMAEDFLRRFFKRFPSSKKWIDDTHKLVHETGQVQNIFGRIRRLPAIFSNKVDLVAEAERQSVNSIVQATASDWTILALIAIYRYIKEHQMPAKLVLTVYDSIVIETKDEYIEQVRRLLVDNMEHKWHQDFSVKMKCDTDIYSYWGRKIKKVA